MNIDTHSEAPVPLIVFPSGIGLSWIGSGFFLFCMLHTRNQLVHQPTHELSVWMETCRKRSSGTKQAQSGDSTRTDRWRHTAAQCYWYSSFNGWMWMMREMKRHKNIYIRLPDSMAVLGTAPPLLVMGGIAMLFSSDERWQGSGFLLLENSKVIASVFSQHNYIFFIVIVAPRLSWESQLHPYIIYT